MDPFWAFTILGLIVAVAAWYGRVRRHRRRGELQAWAARNGLRFAANDPFRTLDHPFSLFREGDGRGVENLLYGDVGGFDVRLFDYWYYEETTDSDGNTNRTYRRFTCGLAGIPGVWCPRIEISPETLGTRLRSFVGGRDLQFESEEFNREFHVRAKMSRFAYALIDARLMEWLLAAGRDHRFEVSGDLLLVARTQTTDVAQLWDLLRIVRGFRDRVPSVVTSMYPNDGAATPPLDEFAVPLVPPSPAEDAGGIVPKWTL